MGAGTISFATSRAIDSVFEKGWQDLADARKAVTDLTEQGWAAAGEAVSAAGDGLSDAWDSVFG